MVELHNLRRVAIVLAMGLAAAQSVRPIHAATPDDDDDRGRVLYVVDVLPGGSAEKAMTIYNEWRANPAGGANFPLGDGVSFDKLSSGDQAKLMNLMKALYGAAGGGTQAFKTMALLIDKGLKHPSADFTEAGHSPDPINNRLSILMAEARDAMIEQVINKVGAEKKIKVARSDSGNTTSGMKSDLDQTFYVFEYDEQKGEWVRNPDLDRDFRMAFNAEWARQNPNLTLDMLDIASIDGKNRFPDPRATEIVNYGDEYARTIVELRTTPGAYTTHGAVLQQMQLRALGAILAGNPRAFAVYGPPDGDPTGAWERHQQFDPDLARQTMFGKGRDPKIMQGLAFGAAVANQHELQHYMDAEKFETKYHLRTWDDAMFTQMLVQLGQDAGGKKEYNALSPEERARFNEEILNRLFPGDAKKQKLHGMALDISADLRNFHKGAFDKIASLAGVDVASLSEFEKKRAIFEPLALELYPNQYVPEPTTEAQLKENQRIIADVEMNHHRTLSNEFCLRSIYASSSEMLGLIFAMDGRDRGWIDPDKVRLVMQGPPRSGETPTARRAEWEKIKSNLSAGARETLLFTIYDLGEAESAELRDYLKHHHPEFAAHIDLLWEEGKWKGWTSLIEQRDIYARYYAGKARAHVERLTDQVRRHVMMELGFERIEDMRLAGTVLGHYQQVTWNFRKFARNMIWDPGSIDALAQIVRTFFESGGDPDAVRAKIFDEMLLAVPVLGQIESVRRGGLMSVGLMALAIKFPPVGGVMLVYGLGEAGYAIYDMEYLKPRSDNIIDAVYRGFVGPDLIGFGEPGQPGMTWNDGDLEALEKKRDELMGQMGWTGGAIDPEKRKQLQQGLNEVDREITKLKAHRRAVEQYGGGAWMGGTITGAAAIPEQGPFENYILRDIDPRIGFFVKDTIDLSIFSTFNPDEAAEQIAKLREQIDTASDVMTRVEASMKLHELELQQQRFDKAVKWVNLSEEHRQLHFRFRMDSLFPSFQRKSTVTSPGRVNQWVDDWLEENENAVLAELLKLGLITEEQRNWRAELAKVEASMEMDRQVDGDLPPAIRFVPTNPIDVAQLKARINADMARSRKLYRMWEEREQQRLAVNQRNLEAARTYFGMEMSRPRLEHLTADEARRNMLIAMRWLAVPRQRPQLEATVYRVHPPQPEEPQQSEASEASGGEQTEEDEPPVYDWSVATKLTVDPNIYHEPYQTRTDFLNLEQATAAASSGKIGDLPLLPDAKRRLRALISQRAAGDEKNNDLVVIVSAVAASMTNYQQEMPNLARALPQVFASLPNVKAGDGFLMAQDINYQAVEDEEEPEPEPEPEPTGPLFVEISKDDHDNTLIIVTSDQLARIDDKDNRPPALFLAFILEQSFDKDGPFVPSMRGDFDKINHISLQWGSAPINEKMYPGRIDEDRVLLMPEAIEYTNNPDNPMEVRMLEPHKPRYFRVVQRWVGSRVSVEGKEEVISNVVGGPADPVIRINITNTARDGVDGDTYTLSGAPEWIHVNASLGLEHQGFHYWGAKLTISGGGQTVHAWTNPWRGQGRSGNPSWNSSWGAAGFPFDPGGMAVTVTAEAGDIIVSRTVQVVPGEFDQQQHDERLAKVKAAGPTVSRFRRSYQQAQERRERQLEVLQTARERLAESATDQNRMNLARQEEAIVQYNGGYENQYLYETEVNMAIFAMRVADMERDWQGKTRAAQQLAEAHDPAAEFATIRRNVLQQQIDILSGLAGSLEEEKYRTQTEKRVASLQNELTLLLPISAQEMFKALGQVRQAARTAGDLPAYRSAAMKQIELIETYGSQLGFHTQNTRSFESMNVSRTDARAKLKILDELADELARLGNNPNEAANYLAQVMQLRLDSAEPDNRERTLRLLNVGGVPNWWPPDRPIPTFGTPDTGE
jgi:hypothetical protein